MVQIYVTYQLPSIIIIDNNWSKNEQYAHCKQETINLYNIRSVVTDV